MKTYLIYLVLTAALFFFGCKKNAQSPASENKNDPFIRKDNPGSAADHQIYLFYKESGIPVLYSDTVSKVPFETVKLSYRLTSIDSMVTVRYIRQQADILTGTEFVKNQIAPYLPGKLKPYSILLTDSVFTYSVDYMNQKIVVPLSAYLGLKTLAISYVPKIKDMTPAQIKVYRKDILKTILAVKISENGSTSDAFFAVSKAYYNVTATGTITRPGVSIPYKQKELYGFLSDGTENPSYYATGAPVSDIDRYLDVMLVLTPSEFTDKYKSYPLVMQKYSLAVTILNNLGFILPK